MSDLREQIANEVHHSKPTHNGCSGCNRTGDAVWTNVVGPALDAKDAEIARLRADCDELVRAKRELLFSSTENLTQAQAEAYREYQRAEQAEATIARVNALIEVWKARGYAMYEGCADELTWALIRPDDQPKDT